MSLFNSVLRMSYFNWTYVVHPGKYVHLGKKKKKKNEDCREEILKKLKVVISLCKRFDARHRINFHFV